LLDRTLAQLSRDTGILLDELVARDGPTCSGLEGIVSKKVDGTS
jgi:hypothetical protein